MTQTNDPPGAHDEKGHHQARDVWHRTPQKPSRQRTCRRGQSDHNERHHQHDRRAGSEECGRKFAKTARRDHVDVGPKPNSRRVTTRSDEYRKQRGDKSHRNRDDAITQTWRYRN